MCYNEEAMKNHTACLLTGLVALSPSLSGAESKNLPAPTITGGMPLMDAVNTRQSGRLYDKDREVDAQTLSEILWVAWGMNTAGKRTIPTARNQQNMKLYLLTPTGTWVYDAAANAIHKVNDKNLITLCDTQPFVKDAPVHLLYVATDDKWGRCHVGSAYQNVYLYAASKGMATVIRGLIDEDALTKELDLPEGERAIVHQTIGWPAKD